MVGFTQSDSPLPPLMHVHIGAALVIDIDVLKTELAEDLHLLARDIGGPDIGMPTPPIIRGVFSPILRKWISDSGMNPIHRAAGKQSQFRVYDNQEHVRLCEQKHYMNWYGLVPITGMMIGGGLPRDPNSTASHHIKSDREVIYNYNAFRIQKIAYCGGRFLTREQCVRFTADRMGGTHTQAQVKPRDNDPLDFLELTGAAIRPNGEVQLMGKAEFEKVKEYKLDGRLVYSLMHLIVLDTARRFYNGLQV
jgi:hypothetical protein